MNNIDIFCSLICFCCCFLNKSLSTGHVKEFLLKALHSSFSVIGCIFKNSNVPLVC